MSFLQAFHCQLGSDPQKRSAAGAQQKKNHQINGKPSRASLMRHPNQSTNIPGWQKSFTAAVLSGRCYPEVFPLPSLDALLPAITHRLTRRGKGRLEKVSFGKKLIIKVWQGVFI